MSNTPRSAIADSEAREKALDIRQSYIVQAPAGSGKTGLLVHRILALLAHSDQPEAVLAITFTRKATAEMRERILELLLKAEGEVKSDDAFEQRGISLAQAVLRQDELKGWKLLDSPRRLQIQTIDALSLKLVNAMPWLSRLGSQPSATDNAQQLYDAALEQFLRDFFLESKPDPLIQALFAEYDFNYSTIRKRFAEMLSRRDQWLRHLMSQPLQDNRARVNEAWRNLIDEKMVHADRLAPIHLRHELSELLKYASGNFNDKYQAPQSLHAISDPHYGAVARWQSYAYLLLTNNNTLRKKIDVTCGFPPNDNGEKQRLVDLVATLSQDSDFIGWLVQVRDLPTRDLSDPEWQQLLATELVLKQLAAYLQLQFRQAGKSDHSEVAQRANFALAGMDQPTELSLKLDYQIQHILVDEFQDTSFAQIELIKRLTSGWNKATDQGARTLFLVGDPMQSIYRFREAEVGLFLDVWNNASTQVLQNVDIHPLRLSHNFRSNKPLVDWFNMTFEQAFPLQSDSMLGAVQYAQATTSNSDTATDAVEYLAAQSPQEEAAQLTAKIKQLVEEKPNSSIAILVRSRSHLDALLPQLDAQGIAYRGLDLQSLGLHPAVLDVLNLARSISSLFDRIAWLGLLRGPWVGLSTVALQQIVDLADGPIWNVLESFPESDFLSAQDLQRLTRFIKIMRVAVTERSRLGLSELVRWCWHRLGGEHTLFGLSRSSIDAVFDLISEHEQGGALVSLAQFEEALSKLYAGGDMSGVATANVVITTVHKAKGLQYDTVVLPSLERAPRSEQKQVLMWAERNSQRSGGQAEAELLIAPLINLEVSAHYHYLREIEKQRAANELVRLMYVATTRAKSRLILSASLQFDEEEQQSKTPGAASLLRTIWDVHAEQFQVGECVPTLSDPTSRRATLLRLPSEYQWNPNSNTDWESHLPPITRHRAEHPNNDDESEELDYEWAGEVAREVGKILHEWMRDIDYSAISQLPQQFDSSTPLMRSWMRQLKSLDYDAARLQYARQKLIKAVSNMREDPAAEFVFRCRSSTRTELPISAYIDGALRQFSIDRTFIEDDTLWVVDYKTTDTQQADVAAFVRAQVDQRHRSQLEQYGLLMRQIDDRPIRLAVYFPLLKQFYDWPPIS